MSDIEPDDIERIEQLMAEELAKSRNKPIAIHEAGHAVVALHLGLPLESVDIEERDVPDGSKFGGTKVRSLRDTFSEKEIQDRSPAVIESVRRRIIMLLVGVAATELILGRRYEDLGQRDQSAIRHALRDFPELERELPELDDAAKELVGTLRADIEKVGEAVREQISMNAATVRQIVGH